MYSGWAEVELLTFICEYICWIMEKFSALRALGLFKVIIPAPPLFSNNTSVVESVCLDIFCTCKKNIKQM